MVEDAEIEAKINGVTPVASLATPKPVEAKVMPVKRAYNKKAKAAPVSAKAAPAKAAPAKAV
jgi:hypothetical protein